MYRSYHQIIKKLFYYTFSDIKSCYQTLSERLKSKK
jgi:hypothetical protein